MSDFANHDEAAPIPPTDFDAVEVQNDQDVVFGWTKPTPPLDVPDDEDDGA